MPVNAAVIGCGYVGAALAQALVRRGVDIVATTTTPARADELRSLGASPAVVELAEVERLRPILAGRTHVYLTVAPSAARRDYRSVYLDGVRHLLEACHNGAVRRIVYTSSTSVYAQDDGCWVDEASPTEPVSEHGQILLAAERALLAGASAARIGATVLRLSGIHGPGRDPAERAARSAGQPRDDGDVYVNLIHRDDIVAAAVGLLDLDHHGLLNLSDGRPILRRELYDGIIAARGLPPIAWSKPNRDRRRGKRVRSDLAQRMLGLTLRAFGPEGTRDAPAGA